MDMRILVVDDELSVREFFEILLKKEGYEVFCSSDGAEALRMIRDEHFDLLITDLQMKEVDGMTLLKEAKRMHADLPVMMITAFATTDTAVEAMKHGAFDYLSKPFKIDEIKISIEKALEAKRLTEENQNLKSELREKYQFKNLLGESEPMHRLYDLIRKTSATKTNVLIYGESGTGKELVAKAIHFNSDRKDRAFVTVNCGAIPENLIESELFGHVKGAFTGAVSNKQGLFEAAHKGTIFLDEIGELPLQMQVKLLRAIQERAFLRVGGTETAHVDVRLIAATNRDLSDEVKKGAFREDLFYRLNVIQLKLPPLRHRKADIPLLANHFLDKYSKETGKKVQKLSPKALEKLMEYDFYGNVRELENIIERSVALETSEEIQVQSLPGNVLHPQPQREELSFDSARDQIETGSVALDSLMDSFERDLLLRALERTRGSRTRAAKLLGISTRSIRYRLKKHRIGEVDELEEAGLSELDEHTEVASKSSSKYSKNQ
ncbi:MAG: sigma-54-dependent Fis family transcriptional regulator [Bradymonadales bacterium]|nr:MAG: sigma-54-dependent Fis family transcriptional regulator [Bradymonadales bacterium]